MKLEDYVFRYSAAAHLAASEKYPDGMVNEITQKTVAGFDALCWAIVELTTQGELYRRHMGLDAHEILTVERVQAELMPYQLPEAQKLIMDATIKGLSMPTDENAEVDVVLQELQKKKNGQRLTEAQYMTLASAAGIGYKEALLMEVSVMNEIIKARYGKSDNDGGRT